MAFASGKHALAICDRCGFSYPYEDIGEEWNGARVCPDCYDYKHPQLEPARVRADPEALQFARPDRKEPLVIHVGRIVPTVPFDEKHIHASGEVVTVIVSIT